MSNNTNKAQYMGFNAGDLALYSFPLQPNQDRPAKGSFAAGFGDNLGFRFNCYPNTSSHRDAINIQLSNLAMNAVLTKVEQLALNPDMAEEGKWQLLRPNKDKFLPTGDMFKVFRDDKLDGCITLMFKSSGAKYPTFPFRFRPSDLCRLGAAEDSHAKQISSDFALAWVASIRPLVEAHLQEEYRRFAEVKKEQAANSGFGGRGNQGGGNRGGYNKPQGGYNKPQNQAPQAEVMDFDEDMAF